jgi:hypothetical protein
MQNDAFITKFNIHDGCRRRIPTTNNAPNELLMMSRSPPKALKNMVGGVTHLICKETQHKQSKQVAR